MKIKCSSCGATPDAENMLEQKWVSVGGHRLRLTYFMCDKCREIHIVQLDDEQSLMCLDEVTRKLKKVGDCNTQGRTPKKRLANGLKKKNKELAKIRKFLFDCYSGKDYMVVIEGRFIALNVEMQEYTE